MNAPLLLHATAVAVEGGAVLLRGPSGAGKSDLALRLIDAGALLVADDQCELRRAGDHVLVRAPPAIAGLIEVRGLGVLAVGAIGDVPLVLVADLVDAGEVERLPAKRAVELCGIPVPLIALAPFEASAAAKLRLALRVLRTPAPAPGSGAAHGL